MRDPNRSRVTIREVAAHAGVSRMTVSRVINGSASVTAETRGRIEAAIAVTGYRPDPIARQLAMGGKRQGGAPAERRIGIVYPVDGAAELGALLAAAVDCVDRAGARPVPVPLGQRRDHDQLAIALERAAADGLLLLPGSDAMLDEIGGSLPMVAIDPGAAISGGTMVRVDEKGSARHLTEALLAQGHRRIGFLAAAFGRDSEKARERGVVQALAGQSAPAWIERSAARGLMPARAAALSLLHGRRRPTAILAANEELAIACLATAAELGIATPAELTLCTFGEATAGREIVRAALPAAEMCRTALRLLGEQIDCRDAHQPWRATTQVSVLRIFDLRGQAPRFANPLPTLAVPEPPRFLAQGGGRSAMAGSR